MPAESQAQQRLMAACEHGAGWASCPKGMTHSQLHDFAATPRKGLPEHKSKKMASGGMATLGNLKPLPKSIYGTDIIPAALTPDEMVLNKKQQSAVMPIPGQEKKLKPGQIAAMHAARKKPGDWMSAPRMGFYGSKMKGGRVTAQEGLSPKMFPDVSGFPSEPWDKGPQVHVGGRMSDRLNDSMFDNQESMRGYMNTFNRLSGLFGNLNGFGFSPAWGNPASGPTQIPTNWVNYPGVGNVPMAVPWMPTTPNPSGQQQIFHVGAGANKQTS